MFPNNTNFGPCIKNYANTANIQVKGLWYIVEKGRLLKKQKTFPHSQIVPK